jgi:hypothetical protein
MQPAGDPTAGLRYHPRPGPQVAPRTSGSTFGFLSDDDFSGMRLHPKAVPPKVYGPAAASDVGPDAKALQPPPPPKEFDIPDTRRPSGKQP